MIIINFISFSLFPFYPSDRTSSFFSCPWWKLTWFCSLSSHSQIIHNTRFTLWPKGVSFQYLVCFIHGKGPNSRPPNGKPSALPSPSQRGWVVMSPCVSALCLSLLSKQFLIALGSCLELAAMSLGCMKRISFYYICFLLICNSLFQVFLGL